MLYKTMPASLFPTFLLSLLQGSKFPNWKNIVFEIRRKRELMGAIAGKRISDHSLVCGNSSWELLLKLGTKKIKLVKERGTRLYLPWAPNPEFPHLLSRF